MTKEHDEHEEYLLVVDDSTGRISVEPLSGRKYNEALGQAFRELELDKNWNLDDEEMDAAGVGPIVEQGERLERTTARDLLWRLRVQNEPVLTEQEMRKLAEEKEE